MSDITNGQNPKHLKSFWPIFIIIVVATVAAGVIFAFAYGNMLQDEVNSANFWSHFSFSRTAHKAAVKAPLNTISK